MSLSGHVDAQALREQQARQQECMNNAIVAGLKAGFTALVVSGGLCGGLLKYSEYFRSHFTVGAKTSFLMLPTFYSFWWASEKSVSKCSIDGSRARFWKSIGRKPPSAAAAAAEDTAASSKSQ